MLRQTETNGSDFPVQKYPSFTENLGKYISEYTNSTSLHGLRYVGERKRTFIERLWWFIIYFSSLGSCIFLILNIYEKWNNSPVILKTTPVWKIPFPAVTICPSSKVHTTMFNFTDVLMRNISGKPITDHEYNALSAMMLVCEHFGEFNGSTYATSDDIEFCYEVAPLIEETVANCAWQWGTENICPDIFTTVLTEEGICFTFNMLDKEEIYSDNSYIERVTPPVGFHPTNWSLERGYDDNATLSSHPLRTGGDGPKHGFIVIAYNFKDNDFACKGFDDGYRVLLHAPDEIPRISTEFFWAPYNRQMSVAVKPTYITTSPNLRKYDAKTRHCYYEEERKLKFFKRYNQRNCEMECLTNFTLETCGCVGYWMPRDKDTKICGSLTKNIRCIETARPRMLQAEFDKRHANMEDDEVLSCGCLPGCTNIKYDVELSQAHYRWNKLNEDPQVMVKSYELTRIKIYFKDMQFLSTERNDVYGFIDFLADCGGLLGLFIGFSMLSFVETIYFLTMRLWCNIRLYGVHFWSGPPTFDINEMPPTNELHVKPAPIHNKLRVSA